jgi:hypothetical protein
MKFLNKNLEENQVETKSTTKSRKANSTPKRSTLSQSARSDPKIRTRSLDWETDEVASTLAGCGNYDGSFDAVIACDCIYNDALIDPLVQTCVDVCLLRETISQPTLCIVAQQLRSAEVFEAWLEAFHKRFQVWRVPDSVISKDLRTDSGYVVHVGILRDQGSA